MLQSGTTLMAMRTSKQSPEKAQSDLWRFFEDQLIIHKADGTNHVFTPSKKGQFFSDVKSDTAHVLVEYGVNFSPTWG